MRYGAASSSVGRGNGRGFESRLAWSFLKIPSKEVGEIAKWPMATDRTSVLLIVRRFDSFSPHYEKRRIKFYPFKSNEKLSNKAPQPLLRVGAVGTKAMTLERGFKNGKLAKVHQNVYIFKKP